LSHKNIWLPVPKSHHESNIIILLQCSRMPPMTRFPPGGPRTLRGRTNSGSAKEELPIPGKSARDANQHSKGDLLPPCQQGRSPPQKKKVKSENEITSALIVSIKSMDLVWGISIHVLNILTSRKSLENLNLFMNHNRISATQE
jgi:hypothetical protein